MNEIIILAIAYSYVVSGKLTDKQRELLEKNNIDFKTLNEYIDKINNNKLSLAEQDILEKTFGVDLSRLDRPVSSISGSNGNSNTKGKVFEKTNGNKQFIVDDNAAFSDVYLFGFLVLVFQVLFLVISYMIFAK